MGAPRVLSSRSCLHPLTLVAMAKYTSSHLITDRKAVGISKGSYLRVYYKNTCETAAAVRGLSLAKAVKFLEDVQTHTQCVPFRRHNGAVGRTAQANAEVNGLDKDELFVQNIVCQQAPKMRRRTYRAHGRINPYQSSPTHLEVILAPLGAEVPAASEDVEEATVEAIEA